MNVCRVAGRLGPGLRWSGLGGENPRPEGLGVKRLEFLSDSQKIRGLESPARLRTERGRGEEIGILTLRLEVEGIKFYVADEALTGNGDGERVISLSGESDVGHFGTPLRFIVLMDLL